MGNELGSVNGKVLGTTLGALYGISLGTYDGTVQIFLELSTEGIAEKQLSGLASRCLNWIY